MIAERNKKTISCPYCYTKRCKRTFKGIFFKGLGVLTALLVISFLIISIWRIREQRIEFDRKIELLEKEINILEQDIYRKEQRFLGLKDEDYLERIARERFHLAMPGEHKVIILPPDGEEVEKDQTREEKNFWQKILGPIRNFFQ